MCTVKFTLPPIPPPLPLPIQNVKPKEDSSVQNNILTEVREECSQLRKRLERIAGENLSFIWLSLCINLTPLLQDGPMCGLVALSMATETCSKTKTCIPVCEIFELAKELKYTNKGEMFSANNMCLLARLILNDEVEVLSASFCDKLLVLTHLAKGNPIIVPYDADFNHEPCTKRGHKAHWAVLLGVLFITTDVPKASSIDDENPWLHHVSYRSDLINVMNNIPIENIYVYARQGKSKHLALWSYQSLMMSNANLFELDPTRTEENKQYLLPDGGVKSGLCKQIIVLSRK